MENNNMHEKLKVYEIKAYNLLVMKKMWQKYRKTLGEENIGANKKRDENSFFQCINIPARGVDRIIALNDVRYTPERAEEVEKRTGISKKYLIGEELIVFPFVNLTIEKIVEHIYIRPLFTNILKLIKCGNLEKGNKQENENSEKNIVKEIIIYLDIQKEYKELLHNMEKLSDAFQKQTKIGYEKKTKNKFNRFCKNVRDMLENKTDSLEEDKLMINSNTLKIAKDVKSNIMSIKNSIKQKCNNYYDFDKELKKEINKIDINDINKEDDINLYRLMYYFVHNKKYDGLEK